MTFRQDIADLTDDRMLVITLAKGERMSNVRARVRRAAKAANRPVLLARHDERTLWVRLSHSNSLVTILSETFPKVVDGDPPPLDCWIAKVLAESADRFYYPQPLQYIARALDVVDRCGELPRLTKRFSLEHPMDRPHRRDHDDQLVACLTEACAFAWADRRELGPLRFTSDIEGAPDIQTDSGLWIEAKSIGPSEIDKELTRSMLASGEIHVGTPRMPSAGLWRKLDSVFADTQRKLARQDRREGTLFLHLTQLDMDSWLLKDDFFSLIPGWIERKKHEAPYISIVVTYTFN